MLRRLPRGLDLASDVARFLPQLEVTTVFDVGANVGQSAARYRRDWPAARVHSFEPLAASHEELRRKFAGDPQVSTHHLALGATVGEATIESGAETTQARLGTSGAGERVIVETLDTVCAQLGAERISFVKIDTEGHDLDVLRGGEAMLRAGRIDLVQVEAGVHPENALHVPLEALKAHLEARGYRLFGLYEQTGEWTSRAPHLRRVNPVFVSPLLLTPRHG